MFYIEIYINKNNNNNNNNNMRYIYIIRYIISKERNIILLTWQEIIYIFIEILVYATFLIVKYLITYNIIINHKCR